MQLFVQVLYVYIPWFHYCKSTLGKTYIFWLSYQKHRAFKCKHNMVDTVVISCAKSFTHLLCFPKTSRHACFCHRYYTQQNYAFTLYGKFVHVYAYLHKKSSWAFPSCHSFFHFQQHCYKMQMNDTTITSCTLCSAICPQVIIAHLLTIEWVSGKLAWHWLLTPSSTIEKYVQRRWVLHTTVNLLIDILTWEKFEGERLKSYGYLYRNHVIIETTLTHPSCSVVWCLAYSLHRKFCTSHTYE